MTAKQKAVTSLETSKARINIGGISLTVVTHVLPLRDQVTSMIMEKKGITSNLATLPQLTT
jgi:hypothetical protein